MTRCRIYQWTIRYSISHAPVSGNHEDVDEMCNKIGQNKETAKKGTWPRFCRCLVLHHSVRFNPSLTRILQCLQTRNNSGEMNRMGVILGSTEVGQGNTRRDVFMSSDKQRTLKSSDIQPNTFIPPLPVSTKLQTILLLTPTQSITTSHQAPSQSRQKQQSPSTQAPSQHQQPRHQPPSSSYTQPHPTHLPPQ